MSGQPFSCTHAAGHCGTSAMNGKVAAKDALVSSCKGSDCAFVTSKEPLSPRPCRNTSMEALAPCGGGDLGKKSS